MDARGDCRRAGGQSVDRRLRGELQPEPRGRMSMTTHLYRSRDDRMLAGVAGGLAELWDADPSLVRIVWPLLVVLTGGIALVVYIVMAIVVPEENDPRVWGYGPSGPGF